MFRHAMLLAALAFASVANIANAQFCANATYMLTVTSNLSPVLFPTAMEDSLLSPITALSHSSLYSAFVKYGYSSPGVRLVAEEGDNSVLVEELSVPAADSFIHTIATAPMPVLFSDSFRVQLDVDCNNPFISFIAMVAPSPDWVILVDNMDMMFNGVFSSRRSGNLFIYDAGTDSGDTFLADDIVTNPRENIHPVAEYAGTPAASFIIEKMQPDCPAASYELSVTSLLEPDTFPNIPDTILTPLTGASHNRRFSALVRYGYATPGVQMVAEMGNNTILIEELNSDDAAPFVKSVDAAEDRVTPGMTFSINLDVDCQHTFISAVSMVAPSPDWIIAIANMETFVDGDFVMARSGSLNVYDVGTDSGETSEADDEVTSPRQNIAELMGEPFNQRPVAQYTLRRTA